MNKTGRRIWYGTAVALSGLVLLLCAVSVIGVWVVESLLSNTVVEVIEAVDGFTGGIREVTDQVDLKVERLQEVSIFISTASARLSEKVTDKGLILLLLPEEKEQNLVELSTSVQDTVGTLRSTLAAGLAIYRSIDRMPFVNLPAPSQEQVDGIQDVVGEVQSLAESVESEITAFRSGASDQIGRVETGADRLTEKLGDVRGRLANLDARLAILQESLVQLQKTIQTALVLGAILLTLLLAWVIYSQVEVLRLYVRRWKISGASVGVEEALPDLVNSQEAQKSIESEPSAVENSENES